MGSNNNHNQNEETQIQQGQQSQQGEGGRNPFDVHLETASKHIKIKDKK